MLTPRGAPRHIKPQPEVTEDYKAMSKQKKGELSILKGTFTEGKKDETSSRGTTPTRISRSK